MEVFARRYELLSPLGSGGFGHVWLAHDRNLERDVAIKMFGPGYSPGLVFEEAQLHVALAGPRVLEVFDASIYNDIPFIVSRVASGGSAVDKIAGTKGTKADVAIRWTRHLLSGLQACHRMGLLHRDIKPGNLFLNDDDSALLGDFGLLERMSDGVAQARGTPAFYAPESVQHGQMSVQSDVYATGLTLWMLLIGAHPFIPAGTPLPEIPALIAKGIPRLRDVAPHIPKRLADIVEKACSADPATRYASAELMDEALGSLPRFERLWQEVEPRAEESRRWVSTTTPREVYGYTVVVRKEENRFDVETRRSGGSENRSIENCDSRLNEKALLVRLRKIFSNLS